MCMSVISVITEVNKHCLSSIFSGYFAANLISVECFKRYKLMAGANLIDIDVWNEV